jgi:organic hydroperoxide reductase OsmC/OhrA
VVVCDLSGGGRCGQQGVDETDGGDDAMDETATHSSVLAWIRGGGTAEKSAGDSPAVTGPATIAAQCAGEDVLEQERAYKSFRYRARTTWSRARRGTLAAPGRSDVLVGSPPEFRGDGDVWSPEELLVGSLNTCMMLTFLTLARGVSLAGYESDAEGLLENIDGTFRLTEVTVRPRVTLASEADREPTRKAMEGVEAHCFIANSLAARVVLIPEFVVAPPAG